jgi:hypothetical protein
MGGNLFKVGRVPKEEYFNILKSLRPVLDKHFGDRYRIPVAYHNKKDYGDVDIIVDAGVLMNKPKWKQELNYDLGVTQTHSVRNVHSMLYRNFQTDVFLVGTNKLETANNFMSYNILGNLIGRIYHKFNLRYGEEGLHYVLRGYNNHISKEVLVSRDMKDMLTFLGLSYERWLLGFDEVEEIFEYVMTSKYFCSNSYDLKYFNVQKRANERPDFNKFLDYLHERNIDKNYPFFKNKDIYIEEIDSFFKTDLREKYDAHVEKQKILEEVSKKFNGKIVMDLIPELTGKELGDFIGSYKESYNELFIDVVMGRTQEEINQDIKHFYEKFYEKYGFSPEHVSKFFY